MSTIIPNPNERRFEDHIEECLSDSGFIKVNYNDYDRTLCLLKEELIEFIKSSQPDEWEKLEQAHGQNVEAKVSRESLTRYLAEE